MGTHASIYVVSNGEVLCHLFSQHDGYPEGVGYELYKLMKNRHIVNGFTGDMKYTKYSNGLEDFAALLVWHFKKQSKLGTIYLMPTELNSVNTEYTYIVSENLHTEVYNCGTLLFDGYPAEMKESFNFH